MIRSNLRVDVYEPYILVALRGTCLRAKFRKQDAPWLAMDEYEEDSEASITFKEFRTLAWQAANFITTTPLVRVNLENVSNVDPSDTFTVLDYPQAASEEVLAHSDFADSITSTLNEQAKKAPSPAGRPFSASRDS